MIIVQAHSLVLPHYVSTGLETELIDDLLEHYSREFYVGGIQEKVVHIMASEVTVVVLAAPIWCWVELSPVPSTISAAYWSAIGGGGGYWGYPPLAPNIIIGTGTADAPTRMIAIPWTMHSNFARVVIQTPVAPNIPLDYWLVQAIFAGKTA